MKFFKKHQEQIIPIVMVILILCIAGYFIWGVVVLEASIGKGLAPGASAEANSPFNITQAQKINFKGLVP